MTLSQALRALWHDRREVLPAMALMFAAYPLALAACVAVRCLKGFSG